MWRLALGISSIVFIVLLVFAIGGSANADSLPQVVFLGEGPGTFDTPLSDFVVKKRPFAFELEPGPTYTTNTAERVWGVSGAANAPPAVWDASISFGPVEAGCIINYVGIDDDLDGRRNRFFVNGTEVELISEGMVFSGEFTVPEDGELILMAEDSVGGWSTVCEEKEPPTPTPTPTPSDTPTPTPTPTDGPSPTPTDTPVVTITTTPVITVTSTPSPTATDSSGGQEPPTVEVTITPTKRSRENACVRVNFDVGGHDAARGLYIVQESGGKVLASWYALDGWMDSGWFKDIDISHENVYVKVLYYRGPDAAPVELRILNHAPDSSFGWMSWGMCHALEVAWPGDKPEGALVPEEAPAKELQGAVSGPDLPPTPEDTSN